MAAGVVPAEGGGNTDGAAVVLVRIKGVIGRIRPCVRFLLFIVRLIVIGHVILSRMATSVKRGVS